MVYSQLTFTVIVETKYHCVLLMSTIASGSWIKHIPPCCSTLEAYIRDQKSSVHNHLLLLLYFISKWDISWCFQHLYLLNEHSDVPASYHLGFVFSHRGSINNPQCLPCIFQFDSFRDPDPWWAFPSNVIRNVWRSTPNIGLTQICCHSGLNELLVVLLISPCDLIVCFHTP